MAAHGVTAVFGSRHGGHSPPPHASLNLAFDIGDSPANVERNIRRFCAITGMPRPHTCQQVHGVRMLWCQGPGRQHRSPADALLSRQPGCALAVRTADCVPILLAQPATGVVAAVHAGWRGTAAGIVRRCCQRMLGEGGAADTLLASIGPGVGACCFTVGADVASMLRASVDGALDFPDGRPDLWEINRWQLRMLGVPEARIEVHRHCTSCLVDRYFSHRREGGRTGRQWSAIRVPEAGIG